MAAQLINGEKSLTYLLTQVNLMICKLYFNKGIIKIYAYL